MTLKQLAEVTQINTHRRKMWMQLISFLAIPVLSNKFSYAYFGGGFVSNKPHPGDIDVVLETEDAYGPEAFAAVSRFFVIGLEQIEALYGVDLHFWMRDAPEGLSDYRNFFQYDKRSKKVSVLSPTRGIVRLDLREPELLCQLRCYLRDEPFEKSGVES